MTFDYLIVGAGLFGATFAHIATKNGKKCLVIDKRSHVAGNCYTERVHEIDVHKYGPHIFHTSNIDIWNFVNEFTPFENYSHRVKAIHGQNVYSMPINMMTFHQIYGASTEDEAREALAKDIVLCSNPRNMEEWALANVGKLLYEKLIYGYSKKQWMKEPSKLSASLIQRLPLRFTWDDRYYNDTFEGIPQNGYTELVSNMLDDVKIELNVNYLTNEEKYAKLAKQIVYTGSLDELYDYSCGVLEYRTLWFDTDVLDYSSHQGLSQMNNTDVKVPHTRIIEHKFFHLNKKTEKTIITTEIPIGWNPEAERYYPVNDDINNAIHAEYVKLAKRDNLLFGGRLASFRYFDMHQVIGQAMMLARTQNLHLNKIA